MIRVLLILGFIVCAMFGSNRADAQQLVYPPCSAIGVGAYCAATYNVKCDGVTDDTAAINAMLAATANGTQQTCNPCTGLRSQWNEAFLPAGTCLISNQIFFSTNINLAKRVLLRGAGVGYTTIKLADNSPMFQSYFSTLPAFSVCPICGSAESQFAMQVKDLTINVGYDNPGATGLQLLVNNMGGGSNLAITCPGLCGGCGLDLTQAYQGPGLFYGVVITGFNTGVCMSGSQYQMAFRDLTLVNQTNLGINVAASFVFSIDGLTSINTVPTLNLNTNGFASIINFNIVSPSMTASPAVVVAAPFHSPVSVCSIASPPNCLGAALHMSTGTIGSNYPASSQTAYQVLIGAGNVTCATVSTLPNGTTTYNPACTATPTQFVRENVPPNDAIGQWLAVGSTLTDTAIQTALNTCIGTPGTGTTVYLNNLGNNNNYVASAGISIPSCVNRIIGFGAGLTAASSYTVTTCMLTVAARASLLVIDDFAMPLLGTAPQGIPYICNPNGAPVLVRDTLIDAVGTSYIATGSSTSNAYGYLLDVSNGVINTTGQNVYGWGINSENQSTHLINNGAFVQLVGFKHENNGKFVQNNCYSGGPIPTTIIVGDYILNNQYWPLTLPAFDVSCGSMYYDSAFSSNFPAGRGYQPITVSLADSTNGTVYQYMAPLPGNSNSTPIAPTGWFLVNISQTTALPSTQTYLDVGGGAAVSGGAPNKILTSGP